MHALRIVAIAIALAPAVALVLGAAVVPQVALEAVVVGVLVLGARYLRRQEEANARASIEGESPSRRPQRTYPAEIVRQCLIAGAIFAVPGIVLAVVSLNVWPAVAAVAIGLGIAISISILRYVQFRTESYEHRP